MFYILSSYALVMTFICLWYIQMNNRLLQLVNRQQDAIQYEINARAQEREER